MPRMVYIYTGMDARAKRALSDIRRCVAEGRVGLRLHFRQRMEERGILWPDVLAVIESPTGVRPQGLDRFGRPKWILAGKATDGLGLEIVCAIRSDAQGNEAVFITIYWE